MTFKNDKTRIFFALLPDADTVKAIEYHSAQLSPQAGNKVRPENYHITLQFLGDVSQQTIEALRVDCDNISGQGFSMLISQLGWWQKPKILWLALEKTPSALSSLVNALNLAAARRKLQIEKRNYFPHVTIMRKVAEPPQYPVVQPFVWKAQDFCMMQSNTRPEGVQYQEIFRWPLLI